MQQDQVRGTAYSPIHHFSFWLFGDVWLVLEGISKAPKKLMFRVFSGRVSPNSKRLLVPLARLRSSPMWRYAIRPSAAQCGPSRVHSSHAQWRLSSHASSTNHGLHVNLMVKFLE
ncbi:hypothetical protein J1N35_021139 [Gossypium stocksii]|uniref:Uncharacterized protein n=1 Tax=Gossypium stocksii TaxID=47602 RepID=A0A9D3VEB2_9ROSI|nr:hypothetical protein J1N35_021139 [Gossypium stocksii]